ncbi:AAA family ATPase [soil metagenome]
MGNNEPRRPMLYIVCGLPFAGKTTMSSELAESLGRAAHVEIDQVNTERGLGINAAPISPMEWAETYRIAYQRADEELSTGYDVVFDATNYSRAQRDILRINANRQGADSAVIFVDVPAEECRERWRANRVSGARYDVRDEDFERVVDRFDPPRPDERVILFLPGMSVIDLMTGLGQV